MIPFQIHGLPVHPLAVHAAVVFVPLAALLAILFVIPRTRAWSALPMALVSVAALISVWVSRESGFNFKSHFSAGGGAAFDNSVLGKAIATHQGRANVLSYLMIAFAMIAVAIYFLYRNADRFVGAVQYVACAVLVLGALVVAFQTYRVGESGSKAVWNPDGTQSYRTTAPLVRHS